MIATDYAKALYQLGDRAKLTNLREALRRRGHEKLMPQIYTEYQKLILKDKRMALHTKTTPERERTRTLLDLYKTHISSQ